MKKYYALMLILVLCLVGCQNNDPDGLVPDEDMVGQAYYNSLTSSQLSQGIYLEGYSTLVWPADLETVPISEAFSTIYDNYLYAYDYGSQKYNFNPIGIYSRYSSTSYYSQRLFDEIVPGHKYMIRTSAGVTLSYTKTVAAKIPYVDMHVHSTRYFPPIGYTGSIDSFFNNVDVDKIFLFGSYPNKINDYVSSDALTDDEVTLAIYSKFPDKVYPFAMGFTPGEEDYIQYLENNVKGKPFVGIGEFGFGVQNGGKFEDKWGTTPPINYPGVETLGQVEDMLNFAGQNNLIIFLHVQELGTDIEPFSAKEIDWSILKNHTDVDFIAPHFIQFHLYKNFEGDAIKELFENCNLYVDIDPGIFWDQYNSETSEGKTYFKDAWTDILNRFPERIMIESDSQPDPESGRMYSTWDRQYVYDFLKFFDLGDENIHKIMYQNAIDLVEHKRFETCNNPISLFNLCGDGICQKSEFNGDVVAGGYCAEDCCGDGVCSWQEEPLIKKAANPNYCASDCNEVICGDGICDPTEDDDNYCFSDCCGNNIYQDYEINILKKYSTYINGIHNKYSYWPSNTPDGTKICYENDVVGRANVYLVDPITTPELTEVELTNLDKSGYLRGDYVDVLNVQHQGETIPTARVRKDNLDFRYEPVAYGAEGYWGNNDTSDEGHRFDQTIMYYYYNEAAKYFIEKFGFKPKRKLTVYLYDSARDIGEYTGDYIVWQSRPLAYGANGYRDIRGQVHEYTHLVQRDLSYLQYDEGDYNVEDHIGLAESFAKYFECAFTNTSKDPYAYNHATGIKDFSNYSMWQYTRTSGREIGFVLASAWWHLRQTIGEEKTDKIVYEVMKLIKDNQCAAHEAITATLAADRNLYGGEDESVIRAVFRSHNIIENECYVIS